MHTTWLEGNSGGLFKPDAYVTRAQVAKMLVRARGWSLSGQSVVSLCDVPSTHWAWSYVQIAIENNAFSGYANGCFYPTPTQHGHSSQKSSCRHFHSQVWHVLLTCRRADMSAWIYLPLAAVRKPAIFFAASAP